jgi:hypothetical protein
MKRSDYIPPVVEIDATLIKSTAEKNRSNHSPIGELVGCNTPNDLNVPLLKLPNWTQTQVPNPPELAKTDNLTSLETLLTVKNTLRTREDILNWLLKNNHLTDRPMQYLGHEANTMDPALYDEADLRILVCRLSNYDAVGGSMTHGAIAQLTRYYAESLGLKVYIDFAFMPSNAEDARLFIEDKFPWAFGRTSKRHPRDFDAMFISFALTMEMWNIFPYLINSGIPGFKNQRNQDLFVILLDIPY